MRASGDAERDVSRTHIVSARLDSGLVVDQTAVLDKSNELTAIHQLLVDLELKGRVVSINALGCQTDIAETIAEGGGYLLAVKDNQSDLHAHLERDFAYLERTGTATAHDRSQWHPGRTRSRPPLGGLGQWRARGRRTDGARPHRTVRALPHHQPARDHWHRTGGRPGAWPLGHREQPAPGAERHLPTFQEDRCRLCTGHPARNIAALRRIALNFLTILKRYFWPKMSIRRLRKMVSRNPARLEPIMAL